MEEQRKLIDFEKARKAVVEILAGKVTTPVAVKVAIAMQEQSVDAVEVVRCKDCRFYRKPFCLLNDNKHGWLNHELPEHFCSHGERETDG